MKVINTNIEDLLIFKPRLFNDNRGYFSEVFNQKKIKSHIGNIDFVQDNESRSFKGTVRGLHFQNHHLHKVNWLGVCKVKYWILLLI